MIYFRSETFGVRYSNGLFEIREFHKYTACQSANQEADACLEKLLGWKTCHSQATQQNFRNHRNQFSICVWHTEVLGLSGNPELRPRLVTEVTEASSRPTCGQGGWQHYECYRSHLHESPTISCAGLACLPSLLVAFESLVSSKLRHSDRIIGVGC